ncbi:MAG: DUF4237 domain-containing protein [Runella slithyformis]|nr:MAG: DUF4237 domain-containing protein [Runella slithyformis]TAF26601.1 MAG: DUF4237 domain-containing protein [Runella slithyformis]TAF45369.1 MAG: DUF4237 domain-containing protein [Runella slithyformis]TAF79495.1 MAG: DUF4237 domain-containing protein [Runella slithyformis]
MKTFFQFCFVLLFFNPVLLAQVVIKVPKPYYPVLPAPTPPRINKNTPPATPTTQAVAGVSGIPTATASAEASSIGRFKDTPVNLYTGTPAVGLPIYTLQEGNLNLPIALSYNASGMKAGEVAAWCGMGWSLQAGGMVTRVVRGLPDEGSLELTNLSGGFTARRGYFSNWAYVYAQNSQPDDDQEPDLFYVNLGGQSFKMVRKPLSVGNIEFVSFPDADVRMALSLTPDPSFSTISKITTCLVITADGTQYAFGFDNAYEESSEIDTQFARDNNIVASNTAFQNYWRGTAVRSAWHLSQIRSASGQEINFTYRTDQFSYFKLAESQAENCGSSTVDKTINRVYVQGVSLAKIKDATKQVLVNKSCTSCFTPYDPETGIPTGPEECGQIDCSESRTDIGDWGSNPPNLSYSKKLNELLITDQTGNGDTLKYSFNYDYFQSDSDPVHNPLPAGFSFNGANGSINVGTTHLRRLRLNKVQFPDGISYEFAYFYQDAPTTFYSRLTYGVDHWGFLNGKTSIPNKGLLAKDEFGNCGNLPNRDSYAPYARYGLLQTIRMKNGYNLGNITEFDYEAHQAANYRDAATNALLPIGGARIKAIGYTDQTTAQSNTKRYTYLQENSGESSGRLVMKPIYFFNDFSTNIGYNSGLYERLLAETNRPVVGYGFVKEETFSGNLTNPNPQSLGYSTYRFDQSETELSSAQAGVICGPEDCNPTTFYLPQRFRPAHDFRSGNLLAAKTYNTAGQILTAKYLTYNQLKIDSVLARKIFRINGYNLGLNDAGSRYYMTFSKFRLQTETTELYGQNQSGGQPITQTVYYTYKDQMPAAYRAAYLGKHNFPVLISTTDSQGQTVETHTKYAADYSFGSDSTYNPQTCIDANGILYECGYWTINLSVPTIGSDVFYLFHLGKYLRHQLAAPVEVVQRRNGQVVGGSYQTYGEGGGSIPKTTYALQDLPKSTLLNAYYDGTAMQRDASYYAVSEVLAYNALGLPTQVSNLRGSTAQITYDAKGILPLTSTLNVASNVPPLTTTYQYNGQLFGPTKVIAPNGLEIRYQYDQAGRLQTTRDGQNRILQHNQYLYQGQTDPSGTVQEDFIYFYRNLTRRPRVASTNVFEGPENAHISIDSYTASGVLHHSRHYRQSPVANTDLVSGWTNFDAFNRPSTRDLPFANADNAISANEYAIYGDASPFESIEYEASPLSRPLRAFGAGHAWRTANKAASSLHQTAGSQVRQYILAATSQSPQSYGNYPDGTLSQQTSQDERGYQSRAFTDKDGRTIEQWAQDGTDANGQPTYQKTAYLYDDAGRLRYVVPPQSYPNASSIDENSEAFRSGIYAFRYDGRGRVTEKHTPNAGWSHVVYNYLNQAVLSQDSRQRAQNQWLWSKQDGNGRTIQSGTWSSTANRQTLQSYFDNYTGVLYETQNAPVGTGGFPPQIALQAADLQAQYFYDDYSWVNDANFDFQLYQTSRYANATGLATGSRVRRLDTGEWLMSVAYYDDKNRVIQTISQNRFGRLNQSDVSYNFGGEVLEERTIYRKPSQPNIEVKNAYARDQAGRVTRLTHTLNGKSTVLADYNFDEISRLKQKKILPQGFQYPDYITRQAITPNPTTDVAAKAVTLLPGFVTTPTQTYAACISNGLIMGPIQTVDYRWHIRGGLRGINLPPTPEGGLNTVENDLFMLRLEREEDGRFYNGLISKQSWQSPLTSGGVPSSGGTGITRSFTYDYDAVNRFKSANYAGIGSENYSVNNVSYDQNGNIQTLQRSGLNASNSWGLIDNLSYNYGTAINQLNGISDASNVAKGFVDNGNNNDYTYYPDGSLKSDANRGISLISYNYLGLVEEIQLNTNGRKINYLYTADGQKLRKTIKETGKADFVVDYVGGLIYHDGKLVSIDTPEGRAVPLDSTNQDFTYQFFYNDHLGNLRVAYSVAPNGAIITQENHYGPTGELLEGISSNSDSYPFLFQGKEREFSWGLGLDDFMTRTYDPFTGRMWQVDGADQFASGYVGMGNNAVNGIDPDGQVWHIVAGAVVGGLINGYLHRNQPGGFWKGFGIGAVAGAVTAATGGAAGVYATTGSFAGAFSSTAVAAATTGSLGGAISGVAGAAAGAPILGLGNQAVFGDPYSASQYGRDVLFGGILGGVGGGISAALQGKNVWNGAAGSTWGKPTNWFPDWGKRWIKTDNAGWKLSGIRPEAGTGQFPAVTNPQTGKTTQTTFNVGGQSITTYYPPNGGAYGGWSSTMLQRGQIIDRFGSTGGSYFSPQGTPTYMRALNYEPMGSPAAYEVLKPFQVLESKVAPAFGKTGFGIQYKSYVSAQELIDAGIIRPIR